MEREKLVDEIVDFCFAYGLCKDVKKKDELRKNIAYNLNDPAFVENLINTVIVKSKKYNTMEKENIVDLIIELEKIRLNLEFYAQNAK